MDLVTGDAFAALSYHFSVTTHVPEVAELLAVLLADLRVSPRPPIHRYSLVREGGSRPFAIYLDGTLLRRVPSALALIDDLLWHVNREAILAQRARLAIHASAAVWRGQGLVMPAPAGSGKTTLVAGLLRAGAAYVTDEAAVIDLETGQLHPYPKPMWMSPSAVRAVRGLEERVLPAYRSLSRIRTYARPSDLDATAVAGPHSIDLVIIPEYRNGAPTRLEAVTRAAGLMALANNTFNLSEFGGLGIRSLGRLVRSARCYRLQVGDLASAIEALDQVLAR
jgi:hypothetical protein